MKSAWRPELVAIAVALCFGCQNAYAGQYDGLYAGMTSAQEAQNQKNWKELFPGLEEKINQAFKDAQESGNFLLSTNMAPIAWNISEANNIEISSINVGYFLNLRDKGEIPKLVFQGLTADSQNVSIDAGNDLIVSPIAVDQDGFGYALSVDSDRIAHLKAGNRIILNLPKTNNASDYADGCSILLGDSSKAYLEAKSIILFGGIAAHSPLNSTKLTASEGIYLFDPQQKSADTQNQPEIALPASSLEMDAPNIVIQRRVRLGHTFMGLIQPADFKVGQDTSSGISTNNVFFSKPISLEHGSRLSINATNSIVFSDSVTVAEKGRLSVKAKNISFNKLTVDNVLLGPSYASIDVTERGFLSIQDKALATGGSSLNINLAKGAGLNATLNKGPLSQINVNMTDQSYWLPKESSHVTNLTVEPHSFIQLGKSGQTLSLITDNLKGEGGVFYLPSQANGVLNISSRSEGSHQVLLSSSGQSLPDTKYVYHVVIDDKSPATARTSQFALANNGIVDAGPYEYKLGLFPFKNGKEKVWVILGEQSQKPVPDEPITPPGPDTPQTPDTPSLPDTPAQEPNIPELPFDPELPPPFIDDVPNLQPIGLSPTAKLVLATASSGAQVIGFLGTTDDLRSRMGEIRNGAAAGAYVLYRFDRGRFKPYGSLSSRLTYNTFNFGFDRKVTPNWILGFNLTSGEGKIKVKDNFGSQTRASSVGLTAYSTWFSASGSYLDTVLSVNRHKQKLHVRTLDENSARADFSNFGFGLSFEVGHQFVFQSSSKTRQWFVEPQTQLAYYFAQGKSFQVDNGMNVHLNNSSSLNGRLGLNLGQKFFSNSGNEIGQIYLRGGVMHDFLGKSRVHMNEYSFKTQSLGTRAYYGVGGEAVVSNRVKLFGQINRESGSKLKSDFQVKAGLKYIF